MRFSEAQYEMLKRRHAGDLALSETDFMAQIRHLALVNGWLTYHTHLSRRSDEGFPDLVLVREAVLFAELKSATGKVSQTQNTWLAMLERTHQVEVYLWRPGDWPQIAARLGQRLMPGELPPLEVYASLRPVVDGVPPGL
jgi:VRR-NUC domain